MSKKDYAKLENHVIELFKREGNFILNGKEYNVLIAEKPRPSHGESKTDVYVLGQNGDKKIELKISIKLKSSNEFQENKMTPERTEAYFGENWAEIIEKTTRSIASKFEEPYLLFKDKKHPTLQESITLGWKPEIADKERTLSAPLQLTEQEIRDYVYKGTNLSSDKKDAYVSGERIKNSGIATYLLKTEIEEIHTTDDVIHQMKHIDTLEIKPTYLIFTGNNYRADTGKRENRWLAVWVKWKEVNGKLTHELVFNEPLKYKTDDLIEDLKNNLREIGVTKPSQINKHTQLADPSIYYEKQ